MTARTTRGGRKIIKKKTTESEATEANTKTASNTKAVSNTNDKVKSTPVKKVPAKKAPAKKSEGVFRGRLVASLEKNKVKLTANAVEQLELMVDYISELVTEKSRYAMKIANRVTLQDIDVVRGFHLCFPVVLSKAFDQVASSTKVIGVMDDMMGVFIDGLAKSLTSLTNNTIRGVYLHLQNTEYQKLMDQNNILFLATGVIPEKISDKEIKEIEERKKKAEAKAKEDGKAVRNPPGAGTLDEIMELQGNGDLIFAKLPFKKMLTQVLEQYDGDMSIGEGPAKVVQHITEKVLVDILLIANAIAINNKRSGINQNDLDVAHTGKLHTIPSVVYSKASDKKVDLIEASMEIKKPSIGRLQSRAGIRRKNAKMVDEIRDIMLAIVKGIISRCVLGVKAKGTKHVSMYNVRNAMKSVGYYYTVPKTLPKTPAKPKTQENGK